MPFLNALHAAISSRRSVIEAMLASGLGAFVVGLLDLIQNEESSVVVKIADQVRERLYPTAPDYALWALILLTLIGLCLAWVHQPRTRVDGFARGLSVLALLGVVAPNNQPFDDPANSVRHDQTISRPASTGSWFSVLPHAWAQDPDQETPELSPSMQVEGQSGTATIHLRGVKKDSAVLVTIRDLETAKKVSVRRFRGASFTLEKPPGSSYLIEVEAQGYRRTSSQLDIPEGTQEYSLGIEETKIPLSILRLIPMNKAALEVANNVPD